MAFLVVAGITVHVARGGASQKPNERGGSEQRAFAGNLLSDVRWEKREWIVTTRPIIAADEATLRAAVAGGAFVTCSGDMIGSSISCAVAVGDVPFVAAAATFRRSVTLTIREA